MLEMIPALVVVAPTVVTALRPTVLLRSIGLVDSRLESISCCSSEEEAVIPSTSERRVPIVGHCILRPS